MPSRRKSGSIKMPRSEPRLTTKLEQPFTGNFAKITMTFHNFDEQQQSKDVLFEFDIVNDTAQGVAEEMAVHLSLNSSHIKNIKEKLNQVIQ